MFWDDCVMGMVGEGREEGRVTERSKGRHGRNDWNG